MSLIPLSQCLEKLPKVWLRFEKKSCLKYNQLGFERLCNSLSDLQLLYPRLPFAVAVIVVVDGVVDVFIRLEDVVLRDTMHLGVLGIDCECLLVSQCRVAS